MNTAFQSPKQFVSCWDCFMNKKWETMVLLHLWYLIRYLTQNRCNVYLFSPLVTISRIQKNYWQIWNDKPRSRRQPPMAFSIHILLGLALSVNFIPRLSQGVHWHPVCSPCKPSSPSPMLLHPTHQHTGCLWFHMAYLRTYLLTGSLHHNHGSTSSAQTFLWGLVCMRYWEGNLNM